MRYARRPQVARRAPSIDVWVERSLDWVLTSWPGRIALAAAGALLCGWVFQGCSEWIAEGQRVRDAMPPAIVARHDHYTTVYFTSCRKGCSSPQTSHHYDLYDVDGRVCSVSQGAWARAQDGQPFKCLQLYGWQAQ